jgi:hypothetical protein
MNPNGRSRFDNESPNRGVSQLGVPLGLQAPMIGVLGVERGSDDDEINLASLSPGSDTVYLKKTYVILDPEVERNGSLTMDSLLVQESAEAVTSVQDEKFVEQRVFFPTFERYFLAKESKL